MTRGRRPPALVYGRSPVLEALRAGREVRRVVMLESAPSEARLDEIVAAAVERGIEVERVGRQALDDIAHTSSHQGVVAYTVRRQYLELSELLEGERGRDHRPAGDRRRGPGPAEPGQHRPYRREAVGATGIVISRNRATEVTPAVAKASAGAVEHLRVSMVSSIAQAVAEVKEAGFWVVGLADDAGTDYFACDLRGRTAVVVGAEGSGLHRLVRERCDQLVRLPMLGRVSSLNAAVAVSIVLYEALRQRAGSD